MQERVYGRKAWGLVSCVRRGGKNQMAGRGHAPPRRFRDQNVSRSVAA